MRRFSFLTLLASLLIVGCTEVTIEQSNPLTEINSLPDLTASFADEGETRTFVEDSKYLRWHEADLITAFFGNTLNRQYKFKGKTGDNSGTFSLVPSGELGTGNDLSSIYAVYPYDENTTITDNGVISLTLPATQIYAENSFGKGANTMVAVTESVEDTFLSFKNACGYLKLKFYGNDVTIASIEVKGNNEEKIAGSATATMEFGGVPTITLNDEATTSVTLDCGDGVVIGATADMATEFWIVLPEITFEGGITITATNTDGAVFSKSTTNTVVITRNDIQPMVALKAEFATAKPANNEIWYTNGSTTEPTVSTSFGSANIVSNTYDNKKECWVIKFDEEVTEIGNLAFYNCTSLKNITIPNSVTNIGYRAFSGCTSLKSIIIPESVKEIEGGTFRDCTSLTNVTIPDSVTNIGDLAFSECTSLTNVTIPDSVTSIGNSAFFGCTSLTSVNIPDSVTTIGGAAFQGCFLLKSITIPNSITTIEDYTFYGCSFTSVTIPDSVTEIKRNPFSYYKNLAKFEGKFAANNGRCLIKDNVIISYANASGTEYTIPDSVTSIGNSAFFGCTSLTSVNIPDSVTTIEGDAFRFCTSLKEVYCKATTPPAGGSLIFDYNASDRKIYVPAESVELYKGADRWSNYADYIVGYNFETGEVVPETPVRPANNEIWYTSSDGSVVTPNNIGAFGANVLSNVYENGMGIITFDGEVTKIVDAAFCGDNTDCRKLTSVIIPDSVTEIGIAAFAECTSLTSVTIPDSVTEIGDNPFVLCTNLKKFEGKFSADNGRCLIVDGVLKSFAIGCGVTEYTIPDSVTEIGESAFNNCTSLTNITIPDGITTIGGSAFSSCNLLTSITISDSVTTIGWGGIL